MAQSPAARQRATRARQLEAVLAVHRDLRKLRAEVATLSAKLGDPPCAGSPAKSSGISSGTKRPRNDGS